MYVESILLAYITMSAFKKLAFEGDVYTYER